MIINIPEQAERIIAILTKQGYAAYVVGGCVRDTLLGKSPCDWDICTSASPSEVDTLLIENGLGVVNTGLKHGTITALTPDGHFEITTFRQDGPYSDHRRPDNVSFTRALETDLSRRDFTVNGMAYNHYEGLIDLFGGADDLSFRVIRTIGAASDRFNEDALRLLRALRFAAVLDFGIEAETAAAIHACKGLLKFVSVERINHELSLLLMGLKTIDILLPFADVFVDIIPEFRSFEELKKRQNLDFWSHTLSLIVASPQDIIIRLSLLLINISGALSIIGNDSFTSQSGIQLDPFDSKASQNPETIARDVLKCLHYDNSTVDTVSELLRYNNETPVPDAVRVKGLLRRLGPGQFKRLIEIKRAYEICGVNSHMNTDQVLNIFSEIISQNQCYSLKDLALNGEDLISLGLSEGPLIGETLEHLLDMVINHKISNTRSELLFELKRLLKQ